LINRGRGKHRDLICFGKLSSSSKKFVIVYEDRIEMVDGNSSHIGDSHCETKVLLQYETQMLEDDAYGIPKTKSKRDVQVPKWFIFAQFRSKNEGLELVCVDSEHNLLIYEVDGDKI
jgi:hypothetical protein